MHYRYIIVGAGSAGCVLANRLSADPATRVLLLEAGGSDRHPNVAIPAAFSKLFKTTRDWAFESEPDPTCGDRRLYIPRGKMLGGSSSMNSMIYIRGHRADYDGWRDAGCEGWGYLDLLALFKKSQNQRRGASRFHGAGGPLDVADLRVTHPLSHAFVEAAAAAGLAKNSDFNGAEQEGAGFYQVTQRNGARWSAADAFLRPAMKRPNLSVVTGARATRLFVEGSRVFGLEYHRRGKSVYAFADGEVVLAAGAIQSPQLLLLSGVGPAADLERLGVDLAHDLPGVGANLHDHMITGVAHRSLERGTLDEADSVGALAAWTAGRRGPLTSNVAECGGFAKTAPLLEAPDLQFHFAPAFFVEHGFDNPEGCGYSIGATVLTPATRGRLSLASADPAAPPRIEGVYLSAPTDLERLVEGLKLAREIARQPPFNRWRGEEFLPGPEVKSDAELEEYVRTRAELLYHPVGTCKMGVDELAVVDPELRVRGLEGLRVADASIMPAIVRGNTNAPTMVIAEKAAELILRR